MSSAEIKKFFEKMVRAEKAIVSSLDESLDDIDNVAVRSALRGISFDSMKHAELYLSAIDLLTERRPVLGGEQLDKQRDIVSRHIKMEEELIKSLEKIMKSIDNNKISFLLEAILKDERRHHVLLRRLHEVLVKGETVTEEDWWDATWRDVPGLWA